MKINQFSSSHRAGTPEPPIMLAVAWFFVNFFAVLIVALSIIDFVQSVLWRPAFLVSLRQFPFVLFSSFGFHSSYRFHIFFNVGATDAQLRSLFVTYKHSRLVFQSYLWIALVVAVSIATRSSLKTMLMYRPVQRRGRVLIDGRFASRRAQKEMKKEAQRNDRLSISIHPNVRVGQKRVARGMLLVAPPGGGKTTVSNYLIEEHYQNGFLVIVHDHKGDYISQNIGRDGVFLLAPWDRRTILLDYSVDIDTPSRARALASRVIQESHDPTWSNGARAICTALIVRAQKYKPGEWTIENVLEPLGFPYRQLREELVTADRSLELLLNDGPPNKTTQSFLSSLAAFLQPIYELAEATSITGLGRRPDLMSRSKLSVRRLVTGGYGNRIRMLIIGNNLRYEALARATAQSFIDTLVTEVCSPSLITLPRKIFLCLDELPQLGRIEGFPKLLEVGRSKGIYPALGMQDLEQYELLYGKEARHTIENMVGTVVVFQTRGKQSAAHISEMIGVRQVSRPVYDGIGKKVNWVTTTEPVVSPDELGLLRDTGRGVEGLMVTGQKHVFKLHWPYFKSSSRPRRSEVPAPWTQPGYCRVRNSSSVDVGNSVPTSTLNLTALAEIAGSENSKD